MSEVVDYQLKNTVAVITINNPPVNALSQVLREGLVENIERFNTDTQARAAIIICAGRTFIAGADISEFNKPPLDPVLPEVIAKIESSTKLIVAAIHGTALGGGFETAMACHFRCAVEDVKVGLPEVKLGLLPGASGTQRLPRLIWRDGGWGASMRTGCNRQVAKRRLARRGH
jgi:3-hydroxyacyl-CoA dehydrogenase